MEQKFRMKKNILIIAEAGVNHDGKINKAIKLVDAAKFAGADIIKFQTFRTEDLAIKKIKKPEYIKKNADLKKNTQFEILKKLELSDSDLKKIVNYCKKIKIEFMSSPFDIESIKLLNKLKIKRFKIPSGEINNIPYLEEIGKLKKEIIISTGMSTIQEIKRALNVLSKFGTKKNKITVLHCTTDYPTKFEDVNLNAMNEIKRKLNVNVGYSDHTIDIIVPLAAVTLGALVIEKHITLNNNSRGPDHKASLNKHDFKKMVESIKNIKTSFGSKIKNITDSEKKNIKLVRKSIVAKCKIHKGEFFSKKNLTTKRPGNGISPINWYEIIGKKSKYNFEKDDFIKI